MSRYPLDVMKSWIVREEKRSPCDTNTTFEWNMRRVIAIYKFALLWGEAQSCLPKGNLTLGDS